MKTLNPEEITKEMFEAYVAVQMKGDFNMVMEANKARRAANLSEEEYWTIIQHYAELKKKFCD